MTERMKNRLSDRERFLAVATGQEPDYVPIFGFPGAPGMSGGCQRQTWERLVATGMPQHVGRFVDGRQDIESWHRYWGTTGPIFRDFNMASGEKGLRATTRRDGEYEIIEWEDGALTRQLIDNDNIYSMPEFIRYPIRDRASWEFYKERMTPRVFMSMDEMNQRAKKFDNRTRPLVLGPHGTYGRLRGLMGPEALSMAFYDDPELVHDIADWALQWDRKYNFPLYERMKPEAIATGEDVCYNHGMLLSPEKFDEFFGQHYSESCACAITNGVAVRAVDTDGNAMEFASIVYRYGINAIYPFEVKAGNDLFLLRKKHPDFIFFGWLEKEVVNEGNEHLIEKEILGKVPPLLAKGRYFPNGDHGIQPLVTFPSLCRFMTVLHEVCRNPEGEFPRL